MFQKLLAKGFIYAPQYWQGEVPGKKGWKPSVHLETNLHLPRACAQFAPYFQIYCWITKTNGRSTSMVFPVTWSPTLTDWELSSIPSIWGQLMWSKWHCCIGILHRSKVVLSSRELLAGAWRSGDQMLAPSLDTFQPKIPSPYFRFKLLAECLLEHF
jgi:hypothetical protein